MSIIDGIRAEAIVRETTKSLPPCDLNSSRAILALTAMLMRFDRERWATCDGECDIALARRQVGPDAVVPGNAKECAELWEKEAARLRASLAAAEQARDAAIRDTEHMRSLLEAEEAEEHRLIRERDAALQRAEEAEQARDLITLQRDRGEEHIRRVADLFGVPDGGRYLNDWRERYVALTAPCAEAGRLRDTLEASILVLKARVGTLYEALCEVHRSVGLDGVVCYCVKPPAAGAPHSYACEMARAALSSTPDKKEPTP